MHPTVERRDTSVNVDDGAAKVLQKFSAQNSRPGYYDACGIKRLDYANGRILGLLGEHVARYGRGTHSKFGFDLGEAAR